MVLQGLDWDIFSIWRIALLTRPDGNGGIHFFIEAAIHFGEGRSLHKSGESLLSEAESYGDSIEFVGCLEVPEEIDLTVQFHILVLLLGVRMGPELESQLGRKKDSLVSFLLPNEEVVCLCPPDKIPFVTHGVAIF